MTKIRLAYENELFKLFKKNKVKISFILGFFTILLIATIVFFVDKFVGIKIAGNSQFSIFTLNIFNYTLFPLFITFTVSDLISGEISKNTIKHTLMVPATRFKIYAAKALAIATYIMINLAFVFTLTTIISIFLNGISISIFKVFLAYVVSLFPLLVFALMVMLISILVKGSGVTFLVTIIAYLAFLALEFIFPTLESFFLTYTLDWYILFIGSFINVFKIIRLAFIIIGYSILLFFAGYVVFEKKDI